MHVIESKADVYSPNLSMGKIGKILVIFGSVNQSEKGKGMKTNVAIRYITPANIPRDSGLRKLNK